MPISSSAVAFSSDLPVLLIHDFNRGKPPANSDTFAHFQLFEPDTNGITSLTNLPTVVSRGIMAARGSSTEGYQKISLKVEFQDELGFGRDVGLLGLPADPDWVLYAPNNFEPILIHNPFAHQLSRDIGRYSPRTRFVEVFLITSGIGPVGYNPGYAGIYVLEEKIKLGDDRVDAPKLFSGQNSLPQVTGGYLMKIDRPDPGDGGFYAAGQGILYVSPKEEEIYQANRVGQRDYLQRYMDDFGNALYGAQFRDPTNGYRAFVHVGSWIDHHLLNVLTFNVDALRLSAYFYKQREGKIHFGPLWDFDRALNSTDGRDASPRVWRSNVSDRGTDFFNYTWWGTLFTDPDFFQEYIDRYQELRGGAFSTNHLHQLVDDLTGQVRKAQPREQTKWQIVPRGGFAGEIRSLKTWLANRVNFMDSQFVRPPAFEIPGQTVPEGFEVVINVPSDTSVYYTLDGTDPRKVGTPTGQEISASARLYSGPIVLHANTRVIARARNPNHVALTGADNPPLKSIWSGPIADTYVVKPFPIRLTEIMYHPSGDGPSTGFEDENFEFLELHNFGSETVDLTGFHLEGTVDFAIAETNTLRTIPPGGRWLLVENAAAFGRRYPGVGPVAGVYRGRLNNDQGRLALFGPVREPVFDFQYSDQWELATDGGGPSLALREEVGDSLPPGDPLSWRASGLTFGSPGKVDPPPAPLTLGARVVDGQLRVGFVGVAGKSYGLQELLPPMGPWQPAGTVVAGVDGAAEFTVALDGTIRLFRVVSW
ncbi:MAG TPA: hypothetical protein DCE44_00445 [Verrucomicrobiales bacterium]|nr:hypothetical protein [Verrucomicrobiales bacterium]